MKKLKKVVIPMNLHLFYGAGAGDGGASLGGNATEGTATESSNAQLDTGRGTEGATNEQVANATQQNEAVNSDEERRNKFNSFIDENKDLFHEKTQKIIDKRFAKSKAIEESNKALQPMLQALAQSYGIDAKNTDELVKAVLNDQKFYEERARENGVSVETQMKFDAMQRENDMLQAEKREQEQQEKTQKIIAQWQAEADELAKEVDGFDLDIALGNADFHSLLVHGMPVKVAYAAAFFDENEKRIFSQAEKKVTDNIRSRGMRPAENGVSSQATATQQFDVSKLNAEQIKDYINRADRGEIISFR